MRKINKNTMIYFFTGKRGGFSHFIPILRILDKKKKIKYKIIASDMHLSDYFGKTLNEVKQYTKNIIQLKKIDLRDSIKNRLSVVSNTIDSIGKVFKKKKPDFLLLLGDRSEVMGAAISAMHYNIPIIHMYGGDVTQGGTDEPTRHAITKMSSIHLTSNSDSYKNVKTMGEENWRVFNTGLTSLDLLKEKFYKSKKYLENKYNIDLKKPLIILLQHSVTWQIKETQKQISQTLKSLNKLRLQTLAIYPCSDPGYESIVKTYKKNHNKKFLKIFKNIEINDFYSLLKYSNLLIGNSSCGITECGFLNKPVINLGIRQKGRLSAKNVTHLDHDSKKITKKILDILKMKKKNSISKIYGNGNSAKKITKVIESIIGNKDLIKKKFIRKI